MSDITLFLTTSVNMLGAHGAHKPTFSPLAESDVLFFDDGPIVRHTKELTNDSLSGTLNNLSSSYPFLQGVEITKQSQYDAGIVKIWSGEPQHRLSQCVFGQGKNFASGIEFADKDLFSPIRYLEAQDAASTTNAHILTFPIVTGDNDQRENFNFNGIIEPLTIRPIVAFFSIEVPFESHTVRGLLMGANANQNGGSDRILTVDYYEPNSQIIGFLDMVDIIDGHPLNGYFHNEFTKIMPFSDERLSRNERPVDSEPADMLEVFSHMTGSTDNYLKHNQRSAACGWYYDNNSNSGTDSMVFGGMTY